MWLAVKQDVFDYDLYTVTYSKFLYKYTTSTSRYVLVKISGGYRITFEIRYYKGIITVIQESLTQSQYTLETVQSMPVTMTNIKLAITPGQRGLGSLIPIEKSRSPPSSAGTG